MIGYALLGTNDLDRAAAFYDAVVEMLGGKRLFEIEGHEVLWTNGSGAPFGVIRPFDGKPATVGNGSMVAFSAPDRETVNRVHAAALSLGAMDEGAPGERGDTFYGAYFRDPDGNKACVFVMG